MPEETTRPSTSPEEGELRAALETVLEEVPFRFFTNNGCLPLEIDDEGRLILGVPEDVDHQVLDNLSLQLDRPVDPSPMPEEDIREALDRVESEVIASRESGLDGLSEETMDSFRRQVSDSRQRLDSSEEEPITSRVNSIIADAVLRQASDVHFEPRESSIRVRLRQNGLLTDYDTLPRDILPGIISRIKVMAGLDIAEQLRPQDGRMNLDIGNREIDVRVSVVPTVHGERAVLRLLDREALKSDLPDLGLKGRQLEQVQSLLGRSDGIVLVTGPTGSGKTTTLYCCLQKLHQEELNTITLEDPVEYQLPGINQIEVAPERDLTFASGLRSVLRQDPDVILVGEIRDSESAQLATHASLTGHLVFSTLHTRRAAGAFSRLVNLGLDPHMLGAGLSAVIGQRLVRTLCPSCREPAGGDGYRADGCESCHGTGFSGRTALFEIVTMDDEIRHLLEDEGGEQAIRDYLEDRDDFTSLETAGRRAVEEGITTVSEIHRVLNL